jgi:hypothetical protein
MTFLVPPIPAPHSKQRADAYLKSKLAEAQWVFGKSKWSCEIGVVCMCNAQLGLMQRAPPRLLA